MQPLACRKLIGIIGGSMLGTDPFDPRSWSGSSCQFFSACSRLGILQRALGVDAPRAQRWYSLARNFSPNRGLWRYGYYLDTSYYAALTQAVRRSLSAEDYASDMFQIGAVYDVPAAVAGRAKCFSYHDGNLAQLAQSPCFPREIPRRKLDAALSFERQVYHGLDRIFTMSEYLRLSFIQDFGVPESKVITIGGGVNLPQIPDFRRSKDYTTDRILFVGSDFNRKGGWHVLEAFRMVRASRPAATLHIVGPRSLQLPHGSTTGVNYYGFLDSRDTAQGDTFRRLFSEATLFVMPSLYEPFGIAPLEAMLYQLPCILTNRWAFPEMVQSGVNGELVDPADPAGLAERILHLLARPELLSRYGEAGRARVLKSYTWEATVSKLVAHLSA